MRTPDLRPTLSRFFQAYSPLALASLLPLLSGCGKTHTEYLTTVVAPKNLEGTTSSGGGDSLELEFKVIGRSIERRIRERAPKLHRDFNFVEWKKALERATVIPLDYHPFHDGRPVDAINFPSRSLVQVFSSRWQVLNAWERERFVTHEVFGLALMDDKGYRRTDNVLRAMETISLINFKYIALDGPTASSLAESVNWKGAHAWKLPSWGFGDKQPRYLVSVLYQGAPFLHCVGVAAALIPEAVTNSNQVSLESPNCLLTMEGNLHGGHTVIFLSETRANAGRFKALWNRLGGTADHGFRYPSIAGILGEDGWQSEIRLHLELRR